MQENRIGVGRPSKKVVSAFPQLRFFQQKFWSDSQEGSEFSLPVCTNDPKTMSERAHNMKNENIDSELKMSRTYKKSRRHEGSHGLKQCC